MALRLNDFDPLLDSLGPNSTLLATKSLDFQGPPLLMAQVMDLPPSKSKTLGPAPYKQQVH
jgi:hypothetical protein